MAKDKKKGFFSWLGFGRKNEEDTQKTDHQQTNTADEAEKQQQEQEVAIDIATAEAERQHQAEQAAIKAAEDEAQRQYEEQQAAIETATEQAEKEREAQIAAIQAAQEQAELERQKAEEARLIAEQAERERLEAEAMRVAEVEMERQRQAELAAIQAAEEALEQQRQADLATIKAAEEQAERERQEAEAARLAEEQAERERQEAEAARLAEEQAERERQEAEAARLAEEQAERERQEAEAARLAEEQAERERQEAEAARLAEEQAERERQEAEAARLAEEQAERERQEAEAARLAEEQAERERQEAEAARLAEEQAERERQEAEAARLAEEQAERERQEAEAARLAEEQAERERQEAEAARLAEEQAERERQEAEAERLRLEEEKNNSPTEQEKPKKEGFFARLKKGLLKTRQNLGSGFLGLFSGKKIDDDLFDELEEQLLIADVGVDTTRKIINNLTAHASRKDLKDAEALYGKLREEMSDILAKVDKPLEIEDKKPYVILMVGVNGVGKTTTIGKLARQYQSEGKSVMLAAGDTFRAAAVEQLQVWGERNKIPVVAQHTGADPASVIFDAIQSAQAKGADVLIADTAGRLQNKSHLMEELKKIVRVMKKLDENAPHEIMLTLDASTGQNAVSQAKLFDEAVGLTGITLTKLDGTAKGGVIFSIADQFGIPIRYIGIGEGIEDLRPFKADDFIEALFAREE
ncbi:MULTISPECIES: signal recognition particle-docking protein FtsY [Providencia]|uniref:signal recognition particle-docking protein FtsY n=1 Tax=Providencia TaxID=586 RepID=UPI001B362ED4|nr:MULTISPECIES: signal recognition particle-docking protein FtsY [Providencia]EJD6080153.1 signal recognition particle-docking protein FtsY [Providencia rettgeri]EJD6599631.1 signal recognition particle-docking protein FtsY [Providencia rettgeri]MBQ0327952.1 signal recognition particle-docking protein FtsY [Providencia rettgeri]MCY0800033.1 signal recognition particle-docking protein FtsY [Providencia rettgeri]WOC03663.1 signal recognition particle-docking protein FtsY [Providencia sp. PROV02